MRGREREREREMERAHAVPILRGGGPFRYLPRKRHRDGEHTLCSRAEVLFVVLDALQTIF